MGFLDKILGQNKKARLVTLTELGKHKAEEVIGSHGIRLKIVNYLEEHDASSVSEISSGTGFPQEQVKVMVDKLQKEQWVTTVKSAGGD
jgi:Mn-dependent DtxR family transcriptional regulator